MEVLWTIPLYFIIPILGLIILISGIINYLKGQNGFVKIIIGLGLLSLPLLHQKMIANNGNEIELATPGKYFKETDYRNAILVLNKNRTFELKNLDSLIQYGKGKWEIHHWDIDELDLIFDNRKRIIFEIIQSNGNVTLRYDPWSNSDIELIKRNVPD